MSLSSLLVICGGIKALSDSEPYRDPMVYGSLTFPLPAANASVTPDDVTGTRERRQGAFYYNLTSNTLSQFPTLLIAKSKRPSDTSATRSIK